VQEYDYIIVGAGSAGCAVAHRLAETRRFNILVLEAGPSDRSVWIHIPIGYGKLFYHPKMNWMYRTEPVPGLDHRIVYQPRGKVVGGSSSINAMVYSRGQAQDYDGWAAMGSAGWGWADVLPYYRRMEDHALGSGEWHGVGGPLTVTDISKSAHPLAHLFVEAAKQVGLDFNSDLNGPVQEGVGYYQINTRAGFRMSAARAYLGPARRTGFVRLETGALVTRILFKGRHAIGVEYRQDGRMLRARRRGEIIVAGGAINTPQLLQLSGIGPGGFLQARGLQVVCDSPAVGQNLQDHLCYEHVYRSRLPSLNDDLLPLIGKIRVGLNYLLRRRGPLSLSVNQAGGFFRSRPDLDRPNIQLYFSPLSYERALPGVRALMKPDPFSGFSTGVSPCRPTSRGHVMIRSVDPVDPPVIVPNYLSTPEDVGELLAGARFLRRLAATPTLSAVITEELKPGPACRADEDLISDIRRRAYSVFHPCGTCRMGPRSRLAVVDPTLQVFGIGGLRIADASIFPTLPSGNTNAPAIMVGERAADLLLKR
jgi:choline dehydrogenase